MASANEKPEEWVPVLAILLSYGFVMALAMRVLHVSNHFLLSIVMAVANGRSTDRVPVLAICLCYRFVRNRSPC